MVDSPAYRLNHEEVIKALEEGIAFAENLNPIEAVPDERGAREGDGLQAGRAKGRQARQGRRAGSVTLPARTVLVAAGTTPNIMYEKEAPGTFQLDAKKKFFQPHQRQRRNGDGTLPPVAPIRTASSRRTTRRPVRHLLRRQPSALRRQRRQGDGVGQGRLSARSSSCSPTSWRRSIPPRSRARRGMGAAGARARRRADWRASRTSSA